MSKSKFYYWKDDHGYFKTETPFVEDYEGLTSATLTEYVADLMNNLKTARELKRQAV